MNKLTLVDLDKWWDNVFMAIKGKKPPVRLSKLVKSKWPKLKRRTEGMYVQTIVTGLLDQSGVKVVDVECDCNCGLSRKYG